MVIKIETSVSTPDGVRAFLKQLLDEARVDAVLVACTTPYSRLPMPTLVTDPAILERAVPLAPVAPFNAARMAARVLARETGKTIAVVLRPCEVRALIELQKLSQSTLVPAIVISMDCYGRMENERYLEFAAGPDAPENRFLASADMHETICSSCRACLHFVPDQIDVAICLAGDMENRGLTLSAPSTRGQTLLKSLVAEAGELPSGRRAALDRIMALRQAHRDEMTADAAARMADMAAFQRVIANCLNCYNCRTACPVCYCRECVFNTDVFAHRPEILIGRAMKKGAVKIPTDTTMFHLTRMAHMAHACVGCGQCSSVCPSRIPVADLFITVAQNVQDHYGYTPGQDPRRPWPFLMPEADNHET